nr:hypothetical protein [Rhodoferax sp.]
MTLITKVTPGSMSSPVTYVVDYDTSGLSEGRVAIRTRTSPATLSDDAAGNVYLIETGGARVLFGTINYETGEVQLQNSILRTGADALDPYGPYVVSGAVNYKWDEFVNLHTFLGVSRQLQVSSWTSGRAGDISGGSVPSLPSTPPPVDVTLANLLASVVVDTIYAKVHTQAGYTLKGVSFGLGTDKYTQATDGTLFKNLSPTTGIGTPAGSVSGPLGTVFIQDWAAGVDPALLNWRGLVAPPTVGATSPFTAYGTVFRTAATPLRPSSLSVLGTMQDGTTFNVTADSNGKINGTRVKGRVDYQYGLVELYFVKPGGDTALNVDLSFLGISGVGTIPADLVMTNTLRYNAVAFSYLPLDAALLGIDPVRLPSDGRVPIFRPGGFAVVGHTGSITATVSNAQVIDCARVRLSRVRVIGHNGVAINTGYTADLEAGTVTFTDVTGYSQPVTVEHRIEDMGVVREIQISGAVTFTRALTHNYPAGSFLSSALVPGDLKSRVSILFDQVSWNGTSWLDAVSGSSATGTYNDVLAPIVVTNKGCLTERWALVFTNTQAFNIVGEHVGVIGTGSTNVDCVPLNPSTGTPYFTLAASGWGSGWAVGNIVRFNTVGAMAPVWVVRTVQQGPNTGVQHSFTLLSRGDVDRP